MRRIARHLRAPIGAMQFQNRYPSVRLAEIQFLPFSPVRRGRGTRGEEEKSYGLVATSSIRRRYIPSTSRSARFVTIDLWRTREARSDVRSHNRGSKVIPNASLGVRGIFQRRCDHAWEDVRFTDAIRRIVSRHSSNITSLRERR